MKMTATFNGRSAAALLYRTGELLPDERRELIAQLVANEVEAGAINARDWATIGRLWEEYSSFPDEALIDEVLDLRGAC
jgi:hypothetical protein